MRHVLVLAYYFPPLGGAGVQRTVKFLKHLPTLGYDALVVTGPEGSTTDWTPPDETLAQDVPASTAVYRVTTPPPTISRSEARRRRLLARPGGTERWWVESALATARPLLGRTDLIYASLSPFGSAEVAHRLAAESGLPWVADLRDPWALDDWAVYPSRLHRALERRRMRSALATADAIVMNTPEAKKALLATFPELGRTRVTVIPNGWDEDDFARPAPVRTDDAFRIVYAGYSHVAGGLRHRRRAPLKSILGGTTPGFDPLSRSHLVLAHALEQLAAAEPELGARLELHVAGAAPVRPEEARIRVVQHGYLPHPAAIDLIRSADLIFLPMHDLREDIRARTVMGKTYEYLAAGTPILAALPEGDVRDLVAPLPYVWVCRPRDVDCLAASVREAMLAGTVGSPAGPDLLARFERATLARKLACLFDALVAAHR